MVVTAFPGNGRTSACSVAKDSSAFFRPSAQLLAPDGEGLRALEDVRLPGARRDPAGVPAPVVGGEGCAGVGGVAGGFFEPGIYGTLPGLGRDL